MICRPPRPPPPPPNCRYNVAICLRLKGLTDGMAKAVEQLEDAESDLLLLPMELMLAERQLQAFCMQRLRALIASWSGTQFGFNITLVSFQHHPSWAPPLVGHHP